MHLQHGRRYAKIMKLFRDGWQRLGDGARGVKENIASLQDKQEQNLRRRLESQHLTRSAANLITKARAWKDTLAFELDERVIMQGARMVLGQAGRVVSESAKAPYMPRPIHDVVAPFVDRVWDDIEAGLVKQILLRKSAKQTAYRELRQHFWSPVPDCKCSWKWLRRTCLHALYPADGNTWSSLRNPIAVVLLLLRLNPWYTPIIIFCIIFFMIDKSDEYMLVNYILKFKGFHFFSGGLLGAVYVCATFVGCVAAEHDGIAGYCLSHAPGQGTLFQSNIWLEPVRMVLTYLAFYMLHFGYAYGGHEAMEALENLRLDAADGALDGTVDRDYLRALRGVEDEETGDSELIHRAASIPTHTLLSALELHRERAGAEKRFGGAIRYFMLYDLIVLTTVVTVGLVIAPLHFGIGPIAAAMSSQPLDSRAEDENLLWALLYFTNLAYALASWPFLVFEVPILGSALHRSSKTGYDKAGALCPRLSPADLKKKIEKDAERERYHERKPKERAKAAAVIQRQRLVQAKARKARLERERTQQERKENPGVASSPATARLQP